MRRQGTHTVAERAARQRLSGDALIPCEAEIPAEYKNSADWLGQCSAIVGYMTSVTMYQRGVSMDWRRVHIRVKFPAGVELDLPRPRTAEERYFAVAYARFKEDASRWDNAKYLSADLVMMPNPILRCDARSLPVPVGERNERGFVPPKSWLREERKSRHLLNLFVAYQHREAEFYLATAPGDRYTELPNDWHEWEAPVSPSASAAMSGVTAAPASSAQPVAASADPTMAALFDIVRARSSASVAPPPGPVTTPSGYVSFTGTVRRSIGVDTHEPEGVIGEPATTSDRLLTSILRIGRSARVSSSRGSTSGRVSEARSSVFVRSRSPSGRVLTFTPVVIWASSRERS